MSTQKKYMGSSHFKNTAIAIAVASSFVMAQAWAADTAVGNGTGVAYGTGSNAPKAENVAVGKGASISYSNGDSAATGDIVVGDGANINNYASQGGSIAIGKNAKIENMAGGGEASFALGQTTYSGSILSSARIPADPTKVVGSIAIGDNTFARTGSTMIGSHNYRGDLGDTTVDSSQTRASNLNVYATTIGANSFSNGAFTTTTGVYNIISGEYSGGRSANGQKNFGATITGALNSVESMGSAGSDYYSGIANSLIGIANRTQNSNGSLIFGAGNEITNSYASISGLPGGLLSSSPSSAKDLANTLRKSVKDSDAGGATLAIGGGNTADYTQASQLIGVNNTLKGSSSSVSQYNALNGYKNTATNVKHVTVIGSSNTVTDGESNIVAGDSHKLTGVSKSVIIGSSSTENKEVTKSNVVVIGQDADIFQEGDVALGSGSTAEQVEATTNITIRGTSYDFAGTSPTSTVSVGSEGKERTITNVAAGRISAASTDAINGSQLFAVTSALDTLSTSAGAHYYSVKSSNTEADSNYDNDGATGTDSIVLGIASKNSGNNSTVIGNMNSLTGIKNGVNNSIVVGQRLEVDGTHNAVFGTDYANYDNKLTKVVGDQNTVIGVGNLVGYTAVQNGTQWTYTKRGDRGSDQNVAVGLNNTANGGSIAVGTSSVVDSLGVSLGHANTVIGPDDTGTSGGQWGVAIGNKLTVSGENAVAVGTESTAKGDWTVAVGSNASTEKTADIAIGKQASATGGWSTALGASAKASAQTSTALGYKAEASVSNGVALGSYSVANTEAGVAGYDLSTGTASTETSVAWKSTEAAVSVGDVGNGVTRQITGVAAGLNDTDAVNVAQLKKATAAATTTVATTDSNLTVAETPSGSHNYQVGLNKNLTGMESAEFTNAAGTEQTKISQAGVVITKDSTTVSLKATGLDNGGQTITNVYAGSNDTDAVNVRQLKDSRSKVETAQPTYVQIQTSRENPATNSGATIYSVGLSPYAQSGIDYSNTYLGPDGIDANGKKITGVAAGSISASSTDAVNGSQLYQTNQAVQQNSDDISKLYNRSAELNRKIHRAGAHAAALAALHPLDFDENHRVSASLGLGQYHSSGAAALGIFVRPTENFMVSLGGSIASGSDVMGNLGVHYRFGGDSVRVNKTELTQQVSTLTAENRDLSAKLASSNSKLEAATSKIDSLMERIHAIEAKLNMK